MASTLSRAPPPGANHDAPEAGPDVSDAPGGQPEPCSRCLCGTPALKQGDLRALCLPVGGGERPQTQIWDRICLNLHPNATDGLLERSDSGRMTQIIPGNPTEPEYPRYQGSEVMGKYLHHHVIIFTT